MRLKFKLDSNSIAKIKNSIRQIISSYQTLEFEKQHIGMIPGGRHLVEALSWPIEDALTYFVNEGAIKLNGTDVVVINPDYFSVNLNSFSLPLSFSIEEKIQANLATMTSLYAEIFDLENRLRFYLAAKLEQIYGINFLASLSTKIRNKVISEKGKIRVYVLDSRNKELEYLDFSDLRKIIDDSKITAGMSSQQIQTLKDKLDYLTEARNLVAHNSIILPSEVEKIKEYCKAVRVILTSSLF